MRMTRQRNRRRPGRNEGGQWLSFSDLMSSLLLIFILIMFYIMYQYFDMYEINMAEIARQQYDLDQANASLEEQQTKLTEAEKQMMAQQIKLNAAQAELDDAESILATQQAALTSAQTLLSEKEAEIAAQQETLDALSVQLGLQQTQITQQQATLTAQQETLDNQQAQIEELVGMRTRIITSLSEGLKAANISAAVDPASGAIALESDVMFSTAQYDLSDGGKNFINRFLPVYLNVLFSEEYRGYVSEIIIEGHTDSLGTYLSNLQLSQRRALAVASYVLGDEFTGISYSRKQELRDVITCNGRSFSDPVLDADGREDMDASRRVVFKFRLTDEQMIQQMKDILETDFAAEEDEAETDADSEPAAETDAASEADAAETDPEGESEAAGE